MTDNHLLLYRLTELMLEHEKQILAVDALFDDAQIGDFVKSIQLDSPYQQMVLEGVLTESVVDNKLHVSFTVEGYFHHILGEMIYNNGNEISHQYLIDLISFNKLSGVKEGIVNCLVKEVIEGHKSRLQYLIQSSLYDISICVKPLANYLLVGDVNFLTTILSEDASGERYSLVLDTFKYLQANSKINAIEKFWSVYSKEINELEINNANYFKALFLIKGLLYEIDNEKIKSIIYYYSRMDLQVFPSCSISHRQVLFIELYNLLVSKGLLREAYEFSLKNKIYDYPEKYIVANYYNILYPLLELGHFERAEKIYLACLNNNGSNGYFLNWSGWIYQTWYELKSKKADHLELGIMLYEKASERIAADSGKYSISAYQNFENLGYAYLLKGKYDKSCLYLDCAISILQKSFLTDTTYLLGNPYEMKAVAMNYLGMHEAALQYSFKSDRCKLLQISEDSPEMAWNYYDRAKIYLNMDRIEDARKSLEQALSVRILSLGEANILTIQTKKELLNLSL